MLPNKKLPFHWLLALTLGPLLSLHVQGLYNSPEEMPPLGPLGGSGTVSSTDGNAFSLPLKNTAPQNRKSFAVGNSFFKENWVSSPSSVKSRQGLGPLFNANSCSSCHFRDGRGQPPLSPDEPMESMLVRIGIQGKKAPHGGPLGDAHYGDQIQNKALTGVPVEADMRVKYKTIIGEYPDGEKYKLSQPIYFFKHKAHGPLDAKIVYSPRVASSVQGLGLLEALSDEDILKNEDPLDSNSDGISGRANWVWDFQAKKKSLGRFGWKANQPHILQQTAGAFLGDMGITSFLFAEQNCSSAQTECQKSYKINEPEISKKNLMHVVVYTQLLAVPAQRKESPEILKAGRYLFHKVGCSQCHVETFKTSSHHPLKELHNQIIHPYTDLLLHDMGKDLADNREDYLASGQEWRTPPLWGIGMIKVVNRHTRFLHDGRAKSIEEAILWHGGESESSREKFKNLNADDRKKVLRFLESL